MAGRKEEAARKENASKIMRLDKSQALFCWQADSWLTGAILRMAQKWTFVGASLFARRCLKRISRSGQ